MKTGTWILLLAISLASPGALSAPAAAAAPGAGDFAIRPDGSVRAGGEEFSDLAAYVNSDYFRKAGKRCLVKVRDPERRKAADPTDCSLTQTVIRDEYRPSRTITIPTVFHVISWASGTGNISDQRIYDQMDALNEDYRALAGTYGEEGFDSMVQFELVAITRTANDAWADDQSEAEYKTALGWDQDRYFNVYSNSASGYLGYSYLPQDEAGSVYDGVVLLYESVGGRDNGFTPYDQGRTLVHETGHYLGLYHTFEEGCFNSYTSGDLIVDTAPEAEDHYGCTETFSCGPADPIHNYMDYTDDTCMHEFTPEQSNRLVCSLLNYRPRLGVWKLPAADSGDYDGDGTAEPAIFRSASGMWSVRNLTRAYLGATTDDLVPADYDGDGTTDIAIFRSFSGLWTVRNLTRFYSGSAGDRPVPGDYDGDGAAEAGVFRPSASLWSIRGVTRLYFGGSDDTPVPGFYDADLVKDIAVFRGSTGLWSVRNLTRFYFGASGDGLVPGDYDGAGRWQAGIFRPSSSLWSIRNVTRIYMGGAGDWALPADYDGDGADDAAIFRASSGLWSVRNLTRAYFGAAGDVPVTR